MNIDGTAYRTLWPDPRLKFVNIIDQAMLPHRLEIKRIHSVEAMEHAIRTMQVRGAPLIGAAAAYGVALAMLHDDSDAGLEAACAALIASRPTAVNLQWAVERMRQRLRTVTVRRNLAAWREAATICEEDVTINRAIGQHGLAMIRERIAQRGGQINILTHCNAGWLATVDWGTALSPIYAAHDAGLPVHVWVDETRPRNQGASLTAWELGKHGVPYTVIADNAGGHLMQCGEVDLVIVGADRVTAGGDVCNKIGTYLKALAASDNHVPFYAAVPSPTIDWMLHDGKQIPIEERGADEVAYMQGQLPNGELASVRVVPEGSACANPAFDVTPARLVTGIITEHGLYRPDNLANLPGRELPC